MIANTARYRELVWAGVVSVGATLVVALIIGVVLGSIRGHEDKQNVLAKCPETELFVFGNKGHRTRVYDCTGVEL